MAKEVKIIKGSTFSMFVFWEDRDNLLRFPISAVSLTTGAPRLSVSGFTLPTGWRGFVSLAQGMRQINAQRSPPSGQDWHPLKVISPDTVELNGVVPVDDNGREWPAYTGGGFLCCYAPMDLTSHTARMDVKDRIGGTVLISSEVDAAPNDVIDVVVDPVGMKTTVTVAADDTAALTFKQGVTNLEMVGPTGVVTKLKLTDTPDTEPDIVRVYGEVTT